MRDATITQIHEGTNQIPLGLALDRVQASASRSPRLGHCSLMRGNKVTYQAIAG